MATVAAIALSMLEPDVAVLTLDVPGKRVNVLSASVLARLDACLRDPRQRGELAGLIIVSGKTDSFAVGADLHELAASFDAPRAETVRGCQRGQQLLASLAQTPFVTVAAVNGTCLGGGAELATWCDRRIVSDSPRTTIGFPESHLGLIPGWGGTVRLPRVVGLGNAVPMIIEGQMLDARAALAMGWASDMVPAEKLLPAAVRLIREEQASREYLRDRRYWGGPMVADETELQFLRKTVSARTARQTQGRNPAPLAALRLMLDTAGLDASQACRAEAECFARLLGAPVNRALVNVFFLTGRNKKDAGIEDPSIVARDVASIGVVGTGIMGCGIAAASIKGAVPVVVTDASPDALDRGVRQVMDEVAHDPNGESRDRQYAIQLSPLLHAATHDAELAGCDIVIESIVEDAQSKKQLLARLQHVARPEAILASNTSTIPVTGLGEGLQRPEQFCGMHFFNPVRKMKLVEVIRGRQTSDQTVATAVAYCKRIGKAPIVVHDRPGFMVNRLLSPYLNASLELVIEGARIQDIDQAATRFGMPLGPLALYDMVGMDTAVSAGRVMLQAYSQRIVATPILPTLLKAGRLGQKNGLGFYSYQNKAKRPRPDPEVERLLEPFVRDPGKRYTPHQLTARLFMPMLLEATHLLEDQVVRDVRDVDLGLILGLGFPAFRGGLLYWADQLGAAKVIEMLKPLEHLGPRMHPTPMLREMARSGRKFYGNR